MFSFIILYSRAQDGGSQLGSCGKKRTSAFINKAPLHSIQFCPASKTTKFSQSPSVKSVQG